LETPAVFSHSLSLIKAKLGFEHWKKRNQQKISSTTIFTTSSNRMMSKITIPKAKQGLLKNPQNIFLQPKSGITDSKSKI
jgi:hypothetical protein